MNHSMAMLGKANSSYRYVHFAFFLALGIRLIYFWVFGDKCTGFYYEYTFAAQALHLMEGHGLTDNDLLFKKIGEILAAENSKGFTRLVQPTEWENSYPKSENYYSGFVMPGYSWFLALVWTLLPWKTFWIPKAIQTLVGALMVYPLYQICKRLFNEHVGIVSVFLYALWLPYGFLAEVASKEGWEGIFNILTVWAFIRCCDKFTFPRVFLLAFIFILAIFFRNTFFPFLGLLGLAALLIFHWKQIFKVIASVYLIFLVAIVPWIFRNKEVLGRPVMFGDGFYFTVYAGMGEYNEDFITNTPEKIPLAPGEKLLDRHMDIRCKPIVTKVWQETPGWYVGTVLKRIVKTVFMSPEWGQVKMDPIFYSYPEFHQKTGKSFLDYLKEAPGFVILKYSIRSWQMLTIFCALLAFWCAPNYWRSLIFVLTAFFGFVFIYAPLHIEGRYIASHTWPLLVSMAIVAVQLYGGKCCGKSNQLKKDLRQ
jgi:hypothetical protein